MLRTSRWLKASIVFAAAAVLALVLVGCGGNDEQAEKPADRTTARGSLETARSQLSTTAPDAKLLVVQTAQSVTETATPVWAYLFGSPENDKTYVVYVANGEPMGASEYGTAGLSEEEWAQVPDIGDWKIDSDDAYQKALEAAGANVKPTQYVMGLQTFVPASTPATAGVDPFVWYVSMDLGEGGSRTVQVNATSGETKAE